MPADGLPPTDRGGRAFRGVVALDGPSGTGKSTVARRLAIRLRARYLDTGAMYRAATLAVLRADAAAADPGRVGDIAINSHIEISTDPNGVSIRLDGTAVDAEIRSAEVTGQVSSVSALPRIRTHIVAQQRELIAAGGIVVEGRDIGSVVWPSAEVKIYLTATAEARARRRAGELAGADLVAVAADIARRDHLDSTRAMSPLTQARDATVVDTTELDIDEVVNVLVDIVTQAAGA